MTIMIGGNIRRQLPIGILPAVLLAFLLVLGLPLPTAFAQEDEPLILEAVVNGASKGVVVEARPKGEELLISAQDIRDLGLKSPTPEQTDSSGMVSLSRLDGVSYELDRAHQILRILATDRALQAQVLGGNQTEGSTFASPQSYGAVLNYDLLGNGTGRSNVVSGFFDGRIYGPPGLFTTTMLAQGGTGGVTSQVRRLDTTYRYNPLGSLTAFNAGDLVTGGLSWTRPFRLGGAQYGSDFRQRPDLVTSPLPDLTGRAAVPSTVDLFVNNVRQLTQSVEPGPFELRAPPILSGADNVTVVVRDAQGRETTQTLSFYGSPSLLAPGLASYSIEAGLLRQNYGVPGDRYAKPAAAGSLRYGQSSWLTLEAHGEASRDTVAGGIGTAFTLGGYALITASLAGSGAAHSGMQYGIGIEHGGRMFSFSASYRRADKGYRDLPASVGDPVPRREIRAGIGLSLPTWGAFRLAYADIRQTLISPETTFLPAGQIARPATVGDARVLSATFTRPIAQRVNFFASVNRDLTRRNSVSAIFGISVALGERTSGTVSASNDNHRWGSALQVGQSAIKPGDFGWQFADAEGQISHQFGQVEYMSSWSNVTAGLDRTAGQASARTGLRGALVAVPQGVFASNTIYDSFAIVDTHGLNNVTVLQENRPVGKTGKDGLLLIPGLQAYRPNRIAIDPADLPADVDTDDLQKMITPRGSSGILADFTIRRGTSAILYLVDKDGKDIPIGAIAVLTRTGQQFPVGFEGQVFLSDLSGEETVRVKLPSGTGECEARFSFQPALGEIPELHGVVCREVRGL